MPTLRERIMDYLQDEGYMESGDDPSDAELLDDLIACGHTELVAELREVFNADA